MPDAPLVQRHGPVQVTVLPLAPGADAEALATAWVAGLLGRPVAGVRFERDAHGRPGLRLEGAAAVVDCNWSHSGGWLAIALGEGVRVGVDIERPRPRPRALELARRYFAAAEADSLERVDATAREAAFLRLWCAKEAVLKAHGRGLAFGLDRLRFDRLEAGPRLVDVDAALGAVSDWRVESLAVEGLFGAVAWRPAGLLPH
jgi:4'-phosphopantetheinyl transferase